MSYTKIRIIEDTSKDYFEKVVNEESKKLNAFATQTHVVQRQAHIVYIAILFYKGEKE